MNAIIGLCHFCEAHGPRPLFCTFTTVEEEHTVESSVSSTQCSGCTSLGPETVFVSRDSDGTMYCSRESVPNAQVTAFLRQAAVRSITCEVSWKKEGGTVYFSDTHGHVLSLMFQICDTRARGLKRWFSIVVLMKDKMLLLNLTPLLSDHMQKISKELQSLAEIVYNEEQKVCPQRSLRLKTGKNDFGMTRSLLQLTGDENVFKNLHSHFTWMLKAGSLTYTETLYTSQNVLEKLNPKMMENQGKPSATKTVEEDVTLRELERLLTKSVFRILLYCTLMGIEVILELIHTEPSRVVKGLSRLIPVDSTNYDRIKISHGKQMSLKNTCVLEETENSNFTCKWDGSCPAKGPTIMTRIENAMSNTRFNDSVLHEHVKFLQLEWIGIAKAVKSATSSSGANSAATRNLKQVLGISPQDDLLVNYWIKAFLK